MGEWLHKVKLSAIAILKITAINPKLIWVHTFTGCIKNKNNLEPAIIYLIALDEYDNLTLLSVAVYQKCKLYKIYISSLVTC